MRVNRRHVLQLIAASSLIGITLGLFGPITLFAHNADGFVSSLPALLAHTLVFTGWLAAGLLVIGLPLLFIAPRHVLAIYSALALLLYLQGNLFVHPYGTFDGMPLIWDANAHWGYIEAFMWAAVLMYALVRATRLYPHVYTLLVFLFAAQMAYVVLLSTSRDDLWSARDYDRGLDELFSFSSERNLVIILLDSYQSTIFSRLLDDDPKLGAVFDGFRYYPNTLGVTPDTYLAVPGILSGLVYDNSRPAREYLEEALGSGSLPVVLNDLGMQVNLLTDPRFCNFISLVPCATVGSLDASAYAHSRYEAIQLLDYTLFRYVPHDLKKRVHNEYQWIMQSSYFPERLGHADLWRAVEFPVKLAENASTDAPSPTVKLFHLWLPHPPYSRDADCRHFTTLDPRGGVERWGNLSMAGASMQSLCAIRTTGQIFDTLRSIGAYHNSDIIVMSDHGDGMAARRSGQPPLFENMEKAYPVLLVKPAGATGDLQVDQSAVTLTDIPRIATGLLNVEAGYPGLDPLRDAVPADRARYFLQHKWIFTLDSDRYISGPEPYQVRGHVLDNESWSLLSEIPPTQSR